MSRVGKNPVPVPAGVEVAITGQQIKAKGKLGALSLDLMREVSIEQENGAVVVRPRDDSIRARMMWGTARTLVANLVTGVSTGFSRKLDINGVGYRAQLQGSTLVLQLGYSHDIRYPIPEGITVTVHQDRVPRSDPHHRPRHRQAAGWPGGGRDPRLQAGRAVQGEGHQVR
jgi:large subunit ribosomal protein L6